MSEFVFCDFICCVDKDNNWGFLDFSTDEFTKSFEMSETIINLGDRENNFSSFVELSSFSEDSLSSNGCFIVVGEEENSWVLLLENLSNSSVIEGHNSWEGVLINEGLQSF